MDEHERKPGGPEQQQAEPNATGGPAPAEASEPPEEAETAEEQDEPDADEAAPGGGRPSPRSPSPESLRPAEALALLDEQWVSDVPYERWDGYLYVIELTVPWHPRGYPYLRAMTGSNEEEVARTHAAWQETQLASDAVTPDPRLAVCLLPLGRRWLVVRAIGELLIADGGPAHASPIAALRMAALRYRAALEAEEAAPGPAGEAGT